MNKQRRLRFYDVSSLLQDAVEELEDIKSEEEEAYGNLSDGLQCSGKGDKLMDNINTIDNIVILIDEIDQKVQIIANNKK